MFRSSCSSCSRRGLPDLERVDACHFGVIYHIGSVGTRLALIALLMPHSGVCVSWSKTNCTTTQLTNSWRPGTRLGVTLSFFNAPNSAQADAALCSSFPWHVPNVRDGQHRVHKPTIHPRQLCLLRLIRQGQNGTRRSNRLDRGPRGAGCRRSQAHPPILLAAPLSDGVSGWSVDPDRGDHSTAVPLVSVPSCGTNDPRP